MAYDVIDWKLWISKKGKSFSIKLTIASSIVAIAGIGSFLGCGIRSVSAKPIPIADLQTLNVGWLNFNPKPIQELISYMVPDSTIKLTNGIIVIPQINNYVDFLNFSKSNRDALELLRDVGVPDANDQNKTTPITSDQKLLVDSWIMAASYKSGADAGIAFISIGFISLLSSFTFLIYMKTNKIKLDKHLLDASLSKD